MAVKVERRGQGAEYPSNAKAAKNDKPAQAKPAEHGSLLTSTQGPGLDAAVYAAKSQKLESRKDIRSHGEAKVVAEDVSDEIIENEDAGLEAHSDVKGAAAKQHLMN